MRHAMAADAQRAAGAMPTARTATVTYGRQVRPVTYPGATPAQVAEFTAAGKYEDFTGAVSALDGALGLAQPGSTRILAMTAALLPQALLSSSDATWPGALPGVGGAASSTVSRATALFTGLDS
jgi:hypothetical protein